MKCSDCGYCWQDEGESCPTCYYEDPDNWCPVFRQTRMIGEPEKRPSTRTSKRQIEEECTEEVY